MSPASTRALALVASHRRLVTPLLQANWVVGEFGVVVAVSKGGFGVRVRGCGPEAARRRVASRLSVAVSPSPASGQTLMPSCDYEKVS